MAHEKLFCCFCYIQRQGLFYTQGLFYLFVPPFGLRLEATWLAIGREHFSLVCTALKEALYKCIDTIQPIWLRERSFATGTSCLSALGQSLLFRLIGSTRS